MLGVIKLVAIILIVINGAVGFLYRFDEGFAEDFDRTYCDNKSDWLLVKLGRFGVSDPDGSERGILSSENSCVTSAPLIFDVGSTLELNVYMEVSSKESGVTVVLTEENTGVNLATYAYNAAHSEFSPGWSRIQIKIEINNVARVSLIGKSSDNELVIVEYIKTISMIQIPGKIYASFEDNFGRSREQTINQAINVVQTYSDNENIDDDTGSGSISGESSTADPSSTPDESSTADPSSTPDESSTVDSSSTLDDSSTPNYASTLDEVSTIDDISTPDYTGATDDISTPDYTDDPDTSTPSEEEDEDTDDNNSRSIWDWLPTALIAACCVLGVILIAVTFYYIGKRRSKTVIVEADNIEPPRTVIIPRVKEVSKMSSVYGYD